MTRDFPHTLFYLPMRIGYTGTSQPGGMTQVQRAVLRQRLCYFRDVEFHHGDCINGDAQADEIARSLGFSIVEHPPLRVYARAFCEHRGQTMVLPPREFIPRNHDIVDAVNQMFAAPAQKEEQMRGSGTWATIRYARRIGKPLLIIYPDGTMERG